MPCACAGLMLYVSQAPLGLTDTELEDMLSGGGGAAAAPQASIKSVAANRATQTSGSRLLPAAAVAPLITAMRQHNVRKDPDAGKLWGRGMRAANTAVLAAEEDGGRPAASGAEAPAQAVKRRKTGLD